jgi:hypothetical protein
MLSDLQTIILTYLPWEEYSDLLLPLYPHSKKQWILATKFTTDISKNITTYFVNGKRHRIDGPAIINTNPNGARTEQYFYQGRCHRANGPARIHTYSDGSKTEMYYDLGKLHRTNGPAYIYTNSNGIRTEEFWVNGRRIFS